MDEHNDKLSWGTKINYGIGSTGVSLSYGVAYNKASFYLLTVLGLSKKFLAPLFFFARIWDGFNDLIMGTLIDSTHTKLGKFRPWIMAGAVTNALVAVALLWKPPGINGTGLYVYITALYLLWDATYTMIDVGYYAMIPALSLDQKERDQVAMIPRIFAGAVGIVSAFSLQIMEALGGLTEVNTGFFRYALLTSAVYLMTSLYSAALVKERVVQVQEKQERFSLKQALGILFRNDQAVIVVGIMLLFNLANNLTNGAAIYYFLYEIGSADQYSFFTIILGASQAIGLLGFPFFSKWFGRERVYRFSLILPCVGYLLMALVDRAAAGQYIPFVAAAFVMSTGYGSMSVMQNVMLADAVDYGEYQTGTRNEGIIFSMLTLLSKMAGAFSELIMLITFSVVKFGGEDATEATPQAVSSFKFLMFLLPPLILLATLWLYARKFRLKPELMEGVTAELQRRRAEKNVEIT